MEGNHNIPTDVQFGLRSGLSTVDAIFFQSIINRILCKNKLLYCCFGDYQKEFDSVDRTKLCKKLFNSGLQGKMLTIIRSLYDKVKYKGVLSDYFQSDVGLMQGETLSPLLLSLFVNDLGINFVKDNCPSLETQEVSLFLSMYADDIMVLCLKSQEGLHYM